MDERRAHESALFKARMIPIIGKLTGTVTVHGVLADVKLPISRDRAMMIVAALLKEAGAVRDDDSNIRPRQWQMPGKAHREAVQRGTGRRAGSTGRRPKVNGRGRARESRVIPGGSKVNARRLESGREGDRLIDYRKSDLTPKS
jgi:hypothetical protein